MGEALLAQKNTESCERINLQEEQVTHKVPGDLPLLQDPTLILPILSRATCLFFFLTMYIFLVALGLSCSLWDLVP